MEPFKFISSELFNFSVDSFFTWVCYSLIG